VKDGDSLHWIAVDLKVDVWCQIWNSRYDALWRKEKGESVEVSKEILIIDRGGGRRIIDLVLVGKSRSPEENQGH
jgi:hypothetical protein